MYNGLVPKTGDQKSRRKRKKKKIDCSLSDEGTEAQGQIKVKNMMCAHCEKRVKDTLLSLEFVESADVSHERGDAIITLKSDVETEIIAKAIEDAGYKVI